jgi:very-short-patch-repair endonuclease
LYNELKKNGFNPIPQVRCGPYRIDLALYEYRLAIECDGKEWHSTPEQKRHDARKNYYLKKNGWKVCRLSGKTINSNIGYAINHIKKRAYF